MRYLDLLRQAEGFQWDAGNQEKNWQSHKVTSTESEQIFFNQPLFVAEDEKHSKDEQRYYALGKTDNDRMLFVVFTLRDRLIRVISVRDMNRKERTTYEQHDRQSEE